jgi:hypothetical protein
MSVCSNPTAQIIFSFCRRNHVSIWFFQCYEKRKNKGDTGHV